MAQVITYDDFDLFATVTDAAEIPIPAGDVAFGPSSCSGLEPTGAGLSFSIAFDSNSVDISETGGAELCIFDDGFSIGNTVSPMDGNTIVAQGEEEFTLVFDTPVQVFGLRLVTNADADEIVTFKDAADNVIDTVDIDSLTDPNTRQFVGFHSPVPIKTVEIDTVDTASRNEGIDRLYWGNNLFEILYLANSGANPDFSTLHEVALDDAFDLAVLTPLDTAACALGSAAEGTPGAVPYSGADMLAGTPDGSRLVFINDAPGTDDEIVSLDLASGACTELSTAGGFFSAGNDANVLAFSPGGVLYTGETATDIVHIIDPSSGNTTPVGLLTDSVTCDTLDISGSDWTFDQDGDLWVWINAAGTRGLYEVTKANLETPDDGTFCDSGDVLADFIGNDVTVTGNFTGWATRLNGVGNVAGSNTGTDQVIELDSTADVDGEAVTRFDMVDETLALFAHTFGDMSNGPLALCENRTIGFYKTHVDSSPRKDIDTAGVTLCDGTGEETILSDADIEEILSDAKGSNFSMLSSQLIAAILNCDLANDGEWDGDCNESGFPLLQDGEQYLCDNVDLTTSEWWNTEFVDSTQQSEANALAGLLDAFNNQTANENFCELASAEE